MPTYNIELKKEAYREFEIDAEDVDEAVEKAMKEIEDEGQDIECWHYESHEVIEE